jgi:UDP-N-acetylmuramate--alanine ligase
MSENSAWLLGVCGMGVGPLAIYMSGEGCDVTGWDDGGASPMRAHLERAGVVFQKDFDDAAPPAIVGRSSAVKPGNPLHDRAVAAGCRLLRRGELLAERVAHKKLVAVCGSHGKTTTSGMLIRAMEAAGVDFGYVLGGLYRDAATPPARASLTGDWVVAEVDESDGTIGGFSPEITVVVNLDWDHPDYYKTEADLERVFIDLFRRTRRAVFIPAGNERLERLTSGLDIPVFRVGDGGGYAARVTAAGSDETRLEVASGFDSGPLVLPVSGKFNTANALMALAVTHHIAGRLGANPLGGYTGIRRRQDTLYRSAKLTVLADYAHHPTEIAALLGWLRDTSLARLVVVFQPHRHTRTRQYAREFASAVGVADCALLLPVYSAGEAPVEGGSSREIFLLEPRASLVSGYEELSARLDAELADGGETVLAFVGAGDIDRMGARFVRGLFERDHLSHPGVTADFGERVRPLLGEGTVLTEHEPLSGRTTLGVGGPARWYAEPADTADLRMLLRAAAVCDTPVFTLGRGSNLLVPDEGYPGLILRLSHKGWSAFESLGEGRVRVGAGIRLKELCAKAAKAGLAGFEFMEGIPGSLGGALRMNAGAMGAWTFDVVESVEWVTPDGVVHERPRSYFTAGYRECPELQGATALSAVLRAPGVDSPEAVRSRIDVNAGKRKESQPRDPSAGCTFKNPPGDHAGRIVDSLNLKGLAVGDAEVSAIHANFIVNKGKATASDVIELIRRVRGVAKAECGVELEPEIILLGKNWKDTL